MIDHELLLDLTSNYLKSLIASVAKSINVDFDSFAPFGELGIDSFYVLKIVKKLESDFGSLPKTLLFENFNIHDLANYFIKKHEHILRAKFDGELLANSGQVSISHAHKKANTPVSSLQVSELKATSLVDSAKPSIAAMVILEADAYADPVLGQVIKTLFDAYKNESSVSRGTRNIAPYLFIGSERKGYFNFSRHKNIILAYGYTGTEDSFLPVAKEFHQYCCSNNLELNIFTGEPLLKVGETAFSATLFGVMQRVLDIKNFTLEGAKMRRLRYQVSKFEKSGNCRTEEYICGSNSLIDKQIAEVIDRWCSARAMVNPLIYIVKDEILAGTLNSQHRLFLTFTDNTLQNVILISPMCAQINGYLMDLEFYSKDMPLGGLEFAIVKMIETLVKEGCEMLSLGGTYGCKLGESPHADPEVDQILDDLRMQNIFNDEGNFQFKNKFRSENTPIFLCRERDNANPDSVIDIIMMIADPVKMQASETDEDTVESVSCTEIASEKPSLNNTPVQTLDLSPAPLVEPISDTYKFSAALQKRSAILADAGFNPLNIAVADIDIDLKTDSWAELTMPAIDSRMSHLRANLQQPSNLDNTLKAIFPFSYFVVAASGRLAEHFFYKAWQKKGVILQNLLFPTGIFHQIGHGFNPQELPCREVFRLDSTAYDKGNLDADALLAQVDADPDAIAMVVVEVCDNAAGGYAVTLQQLNKIKGLLEKYSIPLVIDATRILENAQLVREYESEYTDRDIWLVVKDILSCADSVIASLTKDFCVNKGAIIATNDLNFYSRIQDLVASEGSELDVIDKKVIALGLQNLRYMESQFIQRMDAVRRIWSVLRKEGVPVVGPAGGHCILIDIKQIAAFNQFEYPVASFLAWLYLNTGIRASAHNVGMQKNTPLNELVRLAIPVGLDQQAVAKIIDELVGVFQRKQDIPEVVIENKTAELFGDIYARYILKTIYNPSATSSTAESSASAAVIDGTVHKSVVASHNSVSALEPTLTQSPLAINKPTANPAKDIAIVGMAGRYPKAKNIQELWQNLLQGKDCIDIIPDNRFNRRRQAAVSEKYRGGFIDDVDKFDSLFFNISPKDAETMDPQERLLLEVTWEALEDAGYYPEILAGEAKPRNIGVFVGAVWAMYQTLAADERLYGNRVIANSFLWSIANRISYSMNLTGPSLTVDTACSASLTAVYLACEAINNGECSGAIVGGVNLDLHQSKQDMSVAGGAISKDGLCRSFGKGANGYVAGEGVGAIFLKPVAQAIDDGDHIYGVIKSAVINHGGRTSGYSVPNSKAQTDLILSAFNKANIDARSLGYIEAHGTGTELGDPIEITGLSNAFANFHVKNQSCAIGSIKTNIGHLEAAAGIVSICKVLLQMKHRQLVPSLHSAELNEFIDFANSSFYVAQQLEDWDAKEVDGVRYPLRAGISSFGAGGSNAHIILENYESAPETSATLVAPEQAYIFPLSAKSEAQLRDAALRLQQYVSISTEQGELPNIAYTLQMGRKSFEYRLAIIAQTRQELLDKLADFLVGKADKSILSGHVKNAEAITKLLNRKEREEFIALLARGRDPLKLAQLWIDGLLPDWQGVPTQSVGKRISLPTYPFADKRHWLPSMAETIASSLPLASAGFMAGMHPLIDSNESTFERQLFKKLFRSDEFFIYDHLVSDIATLPGVAYLDLARKAGELAAGRKVQKIKNIVWVSPLTVKNAAPTEAFIELKPSGELVQFEVFSMSQDGKKQLYSQGKLFFASSRDLEAQPEYIDIPSIMARCEKVTDGAQAYPLFKSLGLGLGPSFQVLQDIYKSPNEVLGVLQIPEARRADFEDFLLHPSLVDGSFQAAMAAKLVDAKGEMFVPYSLGEVEILYPLTAKCFSYVTPAKDNKKSSSNLSKMNVLIVDEQGKVLVKISDSVGVPLTDVHEKPTQDHSDNLLSRLYYTTVWQPQPLASAIAQDHSGGALLLFDRDHSLRDLYRERCHKAKANLSSIVLIQPGSHYQDLGDNTYKINPQNPSDYHLLFSALQQSQIAVERICFAWPLGVSLGDGEVAINEKRIKQALANGIYPFFSLCQALIELKRDAKLQLIYLYSNQNGDSQPQHEAVNGFAKILQAENPKLSAKTLEIQQVETCFDSILDKILAEFSQEAQDSMTIRYCEQERYLRKIKSFNLAEDAEEEAFFALKERGVYLITGGAGGLGLIFAEYLAGECRARLVLTGRSPLSQTQQEKLLSLKNAGAEILYLQADVAKAEEVRELLTKIRAHYGQLNGIIHSAGVLRDSYIKNKTREQMEAVFAPKVYGSVHLDELTKQENLDFFVMFSSLAALAGNAGQADYSFANHFMDSLAERRELQRKKGLRSGKTLSLNWSIWAEGGMQLNEQAELFFRKNLGIQPLSRATGLEAFARGLVSGKSHFAIIEGEQEKIELAWGLRKKDIAVPTATEPSVEATEMTASDAELVAAVQSELAAIVVKFLKLDAGDIDLDKILLDLGFDSIGLATFANLVNEKYQLDITPVLFFEYPSIREIAKYLTAEHRGQVVAVHQIGRNPASAIEAQASAREMDEPALFQRKQWIPPAADYSENRGQDFSADRRFIDQPIAIVGMSGVMPQSEDLEEFWQHLKNAENNMVTVIPEERWNWQEYYGDPIKEVNKSNSKWGGFMKEVDKFDPLFFGISPREAEMMDPQQRIFLETVWKCIEDSGHKVSDLAGTKTGLFVGAATHDYTDLMNSLQIPLDGYTASGNSHSVLVNRVSFLLGLRGPSAPIDTACSSSLIAVHRAIESIHTGSCDMAIVGGVQVMLTPAAYISFGMAGMLSSDGKCKTFDKRADGYVRGEGSGAIFLKPLAKAEADGNPIYAVIKATSENHGGRVTFLTAPNPNAQAELLFEAYDKAQIDPTSVGYIECHGTGTSLGDPIEIQALKKSFSELYKKHNKPAAQVAHCGLGTVKSNIGHLETAAGIAGIFKVLLAMKHRKIPATLHFEELNPYINLQGSPFYVVDKTQPWPALVNSAGEPLPRRAGVSSFGFGGANAHVVLEEYFAAEDLAGSQTAEETEHLIVLSAKYDDRLRAYAQSMLTHVQKYEVNLADFAYTLQMGRDAMTERLAFTVTSVQQLCDKLQSYLAGDTEIADFYRGRIERLNEHKTQNLDNSNIQGPKLEGWMASRDYSQLSQAWVKGEDVDWQQLYQSSNISNRKPRRISLPTYPFAKERYWFAETISERALKETLHPLLHSNTSVLHQQSYASHFSGKEFFLSDHRLQQQKALPAMACLEMIRVAVTQAVPGYQAFNTLELHNIAWAESVYLAGDKVFSVALFENQSDDSLGSDIDFEICSSEESRESQAIILCHGSVSLSSGSLPEKLDIAQLQQQMNKGELAVDELYKAFAKMGADYGPAFQTVKMLARGDGQLLAALELPETVKNSAKNYLLHPSMMDGALQSAISLTLDLANPPGLPALPITLASLKIFSPCVSDMYAWIRFSRPSRERDSVIKLDIDLLDGSGKVCISLRSLELSNLKLNSPERTRRSNFEMLLDSLGHSAGASEQQSELAERRNLFEALLGNIY